MKAPEKSSRGCASTAAFLRPAAGRQFCCLRVMTTWRLGSSPSLCVVTASFCCRGTVQDAALVGVHGLHDHLAARLDGTVGHTVGQAAQRLLPLGAVVFSVQRNADVILAAFVGHTGWSDTAARPAFRRGGRSKCPACRRTYPHGRCLPHHDGR